MTPDPGTGGPAHPDPGTGRPAHPDPGTDGPAHSGPVHAGGTPTELAAHAKLTLSLRVTGVRADGFHLLESEMVTLDLADSLVIEPVDDDDAEATLHVSSAWPTGAWPTGDGEWRDVTVGPTDDNLVTRALAATGRRARVQLLKRIPPGAGLGGGSADAAAVLRWAGCHDRGIAARLGADVPFCLVGGRALVSGIGEELVPMPFEPRSFVLLLPPFGVDTAAVYRAWDELTPDANRPTGGLLDGHARHGAHDGAVNELEAAALAVEPRLAVWRRVFEQATGRPARLAGSGSTWFVEGTRDELGLTGRAWLEVDGGRAPLVGTATSPAVGEVLQ